MKKRMFIIISLFLLSLGLTGCNTVGSKGTGLSAIYFAAAVLSLLLLIGCCFLVKKRKAWFVMLFSSVLVVNIGYTLLSVSTSLSMALNANRISYLGSVFLPMSMLMIIINVTYTKKPKHLHVWLGVVAVAVFLIAASPGILDIYYKEVSFEVVNGVSTLVKVYGPLHPLYLCYLLGYFVSMVFVIVRASIKRTVKSTAHAVTLAIAVFVNIGVWFIEQMTDIDFEMLSLSYIISELFLLGVHLVVSENQRLKELLAQKERTMLSSSAERSDVSEETVKIFLSGVETLTPTERTIYESYIKGMTTKEIMAEMGIKENTLKFHNKNLYSKLGVSSRKQLVAVYSALQQN